MNNIWELRHSIAENLKIDGHNYKYDFTIPIEKVEEFVIMIEDSLKHLPTLAVGSYGHINDGK